MILDLFIGQLDCYTLLKSLQIQLLYPATLTFPRNVTDLIDDLLEISWKVPFTSEIVGLITIDLHEKTQGSAKSHG